MTMNRSHTTAIFKANLVWVEALRPSQQFFSHVGTEPLLPGYYKYFLGGVNVLCSRIKHGNSSEDRTPDLSLWSLTLYHQATAPPPKLTLCIRPMRGA